MRATSFLERLGGSAVRAEDREQLQDIGDPYNGVAVDVTHAIASNTAEAGEDFDQGLLAFKQRLQATS